LLNKGRFGKGQEGLTNAELKECLEIGLITSREFNEFLSVRRFGEVPQPIYESDEDDTE
jgi:hypothetical protein